MKPGSRNPTRRDRSADAREAGDSRRNVRDPAGRLGRLRSEALICLLLCVAALVALHGVASNAFVDLDDPQYILDNPFVKDGLTAEGIRRAFTESHHSNWHPLTWMSHMLDVSLFGMDASCHHAVNLLLHALDACLLFLVLGRMSGALWPSAAVAALFAVHPAHVESVAWASERKDTLSTLFWLLTMAAYTRYARAPGALSYLTVCVALAAGLLCKPMLVTLPFVLLLLDFWPLRRLGRPGSDVGRVLWEKLPLLALGAASSVITVLAQRASGALKSTNFVSVGERIANAVIAYARYLGMAVWPVDLAVFYPLDPSALGGGTLLAAAALLLAITAATLRWRRAHPCLLVGWLWYLGTLVPVIGIVQVGDQSMADRYTYVSFIGLFVALAWGAAAGREWIPGREKGLAALALLVIAACSLASARQVTHWRDSEALWTHALDVTSDNATAHFHLGGVLGAAGRRDEQLYHYERALAIWPGAVAIRHNYATALVLVGRVDEAVAQFEEALRINPNLAESRLGLAGALVHRGEYARAADLFDQALRAKPELWKRTNVQRLYAEALVGDARSPHSTLDEAVDRHRRALRAHPDFHTAANNLAWILATDPRSEPRHGREAVEIVERAVDVLGDGSFALLDTLAAAYAAAGRFDEAVSTGERAASIAAAAGNAKGAEEIRERLALYRSRRPYREGEEPEDTSR